MFGNCLILRSNFEHLISQKQSEIRRESKYSSLFGIIFLNKTFPPKIWILREIRSIELTLPHKKSIQMKSLKLTKIIVAMLFCLHLLPTGIDSLLFDCVITIITQNIKKKPWNLHKEKKIHI